MANQTINELTQITSLQNTTEFPVWDNLAEKTKKATLQQMKNSIAEGIVAGVSFIGTRAQYEVAKLIPVGTEGHIPSGSLVIITDENRTYVTSGTGSGQTLQLVARVMSAGNGINISNDDKINADTVTFTGTRAEWEALSSSAKAKYNIVNFTDEMECAYQEIYSESEVKTNKVWTDGKPIYRKTFLNTSYTQNQQTVFDISNLNIDKVVDLRGISFGSNDYVMPLNISLGNTFGYCFYYQNQIYLFNTALSGTADITIEYTKTTD